VLILGGGDGGLIHNLVKKGVAMVTMVEIDIEVVKACRTHMRSVCGDTMDDLTGPNHQVSWAQWIAEEPGFDSKFRQNLFLRNIRMVFVCRR